MRICRHMALVVRQHPAHSKVGNLHRRAIQGFGAMLTALPMLVVRQAVLARKRCRVMQLQVHWQCTR